MTTFIETLNHAGDYFVKLALPVLWQSSLLIAIIFVLESALRRKIRAAARYALWLVVLLKLLLPPSLALPTSPSWWIHPAAPPAPPKAPPVSFTVSYGEQMTPDFPMAPAPIIPPKPPSLTLAAWAIILSSVVSASLFVWLLVRWHGIMRTVQNASDAKDLNDRPNRIHAVGQASRLSLTLKDRLGALFFRPRQSSPKREGNFADGDRRDACPAQADARAARLATAWNRLNDSARLTRLRPGIRLKLTEDSMSPAVCGLFRPVILLPCSLVEKLSAEQLRAVLLHETIHLRRGDVWVNCAQALLQIVYWWHPLLWLANARIRRVREEAVDDAVMLALRDDAEIYAPTLLEVAKLAFNCPLASLGLVGILESRSALRQRIERLMDFDAPRKAGLTVISILGILAFSAVALPMGEAPEKTNAEVIALQKSDLPRVATNAIVASELVQDGKLLYEAGKFNDAEAKLKAALALNPTNQAAHYYLDLILKSRWVPKSQGQIIVSPLFEGSPTNFGAVQTSSGREAIYRKLNNIRLESVAWSNGIPLSEAIRFLNEQSRLRTSDKRGINFLFNPNEGQSENTATTPVHINPITGQLETTLTNSVDPTTISVKLGMKNVSLHDLLDAIVSAADHPIKYSVEDFGVVISPKVPTPPQLEMRVFKIDMNAFVAGVRNIVSGNVIVFRADTNSFASGLRGVRNLQPNDVVTMAQNLFNQLGVDLSAPGRAIAFNDRLGLLFVRATPSEMDTVERVIESLNQIPPQIHIKARFIEVPMAEAEAILKAGTVVNAGETNTAEIVTADKMKSLLRQLDSAGGALNLAEPEAVTTSGRQTQMRATDIEDVVTNFTSNSTNVVPQIGKVEIGPTIDIIPYVLADGYTINLAAIPQLLEFLGYDKIPVPNKTGQNVSLPTVLPHFRARQTVADVNLWDGQTMVLGNLKIFP
jgi:beta-lactamase regulating signal transducer with metallopeptidase domain